MADSFDRHHLAAAGSFTLAAIVLFLGSRELQAAGAENRDDSQSLESRVMPLIKEHKGKVAVAIKHLGTGESFEYHAADVMPTASLIKFPVMVEAYRQAAAKRVDLDALITLRKADKVPGSGVLTYHFSEGA